MSISKARLNAALHEPLELPQEEGSLEELKPEDFYPRPETPPFPMALDNTIISTFRECPQKAFRSYFQHLAPSTTSIHLIAGAAYAAGLEAARNAFYLHGATPTRAKAVGVITLLKSWGDYDPHWGQPKGLDLMVLALWETLDYWPLGEDIVAPLEYGDRNGVEFSFALPIGVDHPTTGEPILYTGRIDMLCIYEQALFAEDDKTTGQLGATWTRQWDLRAQFTGYCWALREYNLPAAGTLVRGTSIQKLGNKHATAIVYQPDWKIDRWLRQTRRDINRMIECWREGYWDFNLGDSCTAFGGCPFKDLCNSANPERLIPTNFVERVWDPLIKT